MSEKVKANLIKYGSAIAAGLLLAYVYVALRDLSAEPLVDKYRILCDAFTVPGVLLVMSGALMSISNAGALDGLGYLVKQGIGMLIPGKGLGMEKYADYIERRRANRVTGYGFLYITGAGFMIVAFVFMALFYSVYQ